MVIAVIAALAAAGCIGYYFGRRAASAPSSWKRRTSRVALSGQAINLLAMITARRIQRRFRVERIVSDVAARYGLRTVAPLQFRRGGVARLRSY
ncbi:hypothetical protein [Mycolicibacterium vulneris]|jgi:hypothetical protein|nr:hypothetical protein [Mycolicibacterium vulneris]